MKDMVSIIIPVYNTAEYLRECVISVMNQTYKNLQIILVDDGATDESPALCDELAKEDVRIYVIHKANEGLGLTRNVGLKVAIGTYLSFLDSDDTIENTTIEKCVNALNEKQADACFYGRKTQGADGKYTVNSNIPEKKEFVGDEIRKEFAKTYIGQLPNEESKPFIQPSACCAMYKRQIIEDYGILFLSERKCLSEDTFFNLDFCYYANKVLVLTDNFYNYRFNGNSLTKSYNSKKIEQTKEFYRILLPYAKKYENMEHVKLRIQYRFYVYIRHYVEYEIKAYRINGINKTLKRLKEICGDHFIISNLNILLTEHLGLKKQIFIYLLTKRKVVFLMLYYIIC